MARQIPLRVSTVEHYAADFQRVVRDGRPRSPAKCTTCAGTGHAVPENLVQEAAAVARLRPPADTDIDQCWLTDHDLARRVHAVLEAHDPAVSHVAFVGDDDLASLLLLRVGTPGRVLVVELDARIRRVIAEHRPAVSPGADLRLVGVNLAHLPDRIEALDGEIESYDLVVTDPPYADAGMLSFIYASALLLRLGGELHLAAPLMEAEAWSEDLLHLVQTELLELGFVITSVVPGFYCYIQSDVVSVRLSARKRRNLDVASVLGRAAALNRDRFYTTRHQAG